MCTTADMGVDVYLFCCSVNTRLLHLTGMSSDQIKIKVYRNPKQEGRKERNRLKETEHSHKQIIFNDGDA